MDSQNQQQPPNTVINNSMQANSLNAPIIKLETPKLCDRLSTGRLASLKLPRDLTLGGPIKLPRDLLGQKNKKVYTPNLNIIRNKITPKNAVKVDQSKKRSREIQNNKNRNKPTSTLIQSKGVFSEGTAQTFNKRSGFNSERSSLNKNDITSSLSKPSLNKKVNGQHDKEQGKFHLDNITKEMFDSDNYDENYVIPIDLPLHKKLKYKGNFKEEMKVMKMDIDSLDYVFREDKHNFLLFQFPDSLPGRGQANEVPTESKVHKFFPKSRCTINDLSEGLLGRIIIHKSGLTKFVIGNMELNLEPGVHPIYQQKIISTGNNDGDKHKIISLGSLSQSFVAFPNWTYILDQAKSAGNQNSPYAPQ